ncbi:GGDEF domain-containing protein [Arenimonas composti]|uniref:diguanylate cyclase n=1 Tax=Arenimonas composti TR7-09 = DSM 18010 TaxID=1121013 RepID=A0A091BH65_9GAMM|nr:GGDEF domain-containing protein [Arenimonas composti]KFN51091.1 hypothetical protein P873_04105 [Arenimonas composti TR7-09 = DSM 18010]
MQRTGRIISALAIVLVACLGLIGAGGAIATPERQGASADAAPPVSLPFDLAILEAPLGTPLPEITSGRARLGFIPLLSPGARLDAHPDKAVWARLRTRLPPGPSERWQIDIVRVPLNVVRLRLPDGSLVLERTFYEAPGEREPWSSQFELPLPPGLSGEIELYLELEGDVRGGLHVSVLPVAASERASAGARVYFRSVYGLLLLAAALGLARRLREPSSGALAVSAAAVASWLACLGINGHLYSLPEVARLANFGATAPMALLLLAAGPLVLATARYSAVERSAPWLWPYARGLAWSLIAAALASMVLVSGTDARLVQVVATAGFAAAILVSALMLLCDSRATRWAPLASLSMLVALWVLRELCDRQILRPTLFYLYGWQLMLAATMVLLVALPWIRSALQRWQVRRRATPPEPSPEEKIKLARERLLASLQSGLKNADDGDMTWIAFRRLLDGLKTVLPQTSAAVVANNFRGDDQLQVEPKEAEPRYRELLAQRATLLKNISRLRAPQQISIDFDGPEGPLDQVQLAVIPLPVPKPGWGALLVERAKDVTYSDDELDLCAEFAQVAMLAGEEAAAAVSAQRTAETDPDTGLLRTEPLRAHLQKRIDATRQRQKPLSVLAVLLDQADSLRAAGGADALAAALRPVAELLRDEIDYGDLVGRGGDDGFVVIAENRRLIEARDYAERLRVAMTRLPIDPKIAPMLSISIGVAQLGDDRDPVILLQRADRAAQIARRNGGNQVFS